MIFIQMDSGLSDLLDIVAEEADVKSFKYVTTYNSIKRWSILPDKETDFWKGYCSLVDSDPQAKLCLAEKMHEESPIIVNLKLRFKIENDEDLGDWKAYNESFIAHVCHIYQSVIIETLNIVDVNYVELIVAVLESSSNYIETDDKIKQKVLCTDIRLQFPYARVDVGFQKRVLRERAIQLLNDSDCLEKLRKKPLDKWNKIISDNFDSPKMMYGSTENPEQPKLLLTHLWYWIEKNMLEDENFDDINLSLSDIFDPKNHQDIVNNKMNSDVISGSELSSGEDKATFWLPMFLSLDFWGTSLELKTQDDGRFKKNPNQKQNVFEYKNDWNVTTVADTTLGICEKMIPVLDFDRYYVETSWFDIGKALFHSSRYIDKDLGLKIWIKQTLKVLESSKRPIPKYMLAHGEPEQTMRFFYASFAGKPITEKTLAFYARIDNPEIYSEWHKTWCTTAISKALNCSHLDVAEAVWRVYWLDFLYCPNDDMWLYFNEGKWNLDKKNLRIMEIISIDFIKRVELMISNIRDSMHNADEENDGATENGNATIIKLNGLILKLKDIRYIKNIVEALRIKFKNTKFASSCDANPHTLGIENGVFEVIGDRIQFRPAKPEDYILLNTGCEYPTDYTMETPAVKECIKWMEQVFPDKELRHHFMKFSASCVKGRNSDKIFPIFTGEGNNSKSMIVKLFMKVFGQYAIKFDMANVTGRNNNPGSASPHLARAKAVRMGFMDEAADDVPMHKETIKRVIGGDSFYTRKLHDNGGDIEVFFKLVLSCNKVPIIPKADTAIKNRVKIFIFESTWAATVMVDGEMIPVPDDGIVVNGVHYFKLDQLFEERIPELATAFMWLLAEYYPYYAAEKLSDPEIVKRKTDEYWEDNNVYAQFAADCVVVDKGNQNVKVSFTEIYSKFRIWWKESFDGVKVPEKPQVKKDLQGRWGSLNGKYWYGVSLIEDEYGHDPRAVADRKQPVAQQPPPQTVTTVPTSTIPTSIISTTMPTSTTPISIISTTVPTSTVPTTTVPTTTVPISIAAETSLSQTAVETSLSKTAAEKKMHGAVRLAQEFTEKVRSEKHDIRNMHEFTGDVPTQLLSPGIIAMVSGEINAEEDGAFDI
jgi:phage/plasmid-associated DNA primase